MERTAVEEHLVSLGRLLGRQLVNGRRGQLADIQVAERRGGFESQQFDRPLHGNRLAGGAGIRHHGIFGNLHAVANQGNPVVDHFHIERIPHTGSIVGNRFRRLVRPLQARTGAAAEANQRHGAHTDAGLALRSPLEPELEVLVLLFGADGSRSLAREGEAAVRGTPVGGHRLGSRFAKLRELAGRKFFAPGGRCGHSRPARQSLRRQEGEARSGDFTEQFGNLIDSVSRIRIGFGKSLIDFQSLFQRLADGIAAGHRIAFGHNRLHGGGGSGGRLCVAEVFHSQHQRGHDTHTGEITDQFILHGSRGIELESPAVKLVTAHRGDVLLRSQVGVAHQRTVGQRRLFRRDVVKDFGHNRVFHSQQGCERSVAVTRAEPVQEAADSLLRAGLRQHGIIARRVLRSLHIPLDGLVLRVGGKLSGSADQRRLHGARMGVAGRVEQFGQPIHMLRPDNIREGRIGGCAHVGIGGLEQREYPLRNRIHAACGGQFERRNERPGVFPGNQPFDFGIDWPVERHEGFHRGCGMGPFERPGQSRERLLAADTARSLDCGFRHAVVGRRDGGRDCIALRHGAALTQPSDNGGLRPGIVAGHAGGKLCEQVVAALAQRLEGGVAVLRRAVLDGFQHVGHRLFSAERIDENPQCGAPDIRKVAFEQPFGGFHGLCIACGGKPCQQAQVSIRGAGPVTAVADAGRSSGQRLDRRTRTADSQCIIHLFGRRRIGADEPLREQRFGFSHPFLGKSIGQCAFPFRSEALPAGLREQYLLGAGSRNQRPEGVIGEVRIVQVAYERFGIGGRRAKLQLREEESPVGIVPTTVERREQPLAHFGTQRFVRRVGHIGCNAVQGVFERGVLALVGRNEHGGNHFDALAPGGGEFAHNLIENGSVGSRKLCEAVGNDGFHGALARVELLGGSSCGQQGGHSAQ